MIKHCRIVLSLGREGRGYAPINVKPEWGGGDGLTLIAPQRGICHVILSGWGNLPKILCNVHEQGVIPFRILRVGN